MSEEDYNHSSYREADAGETYDKYPRVNSTHNRTIYSRLVQLANNIDFSSPIFNGKMKRTRSIGSAQALVVELALADRKWIDENLKPFCIGEGANLRFMDHYIDTDYFDRLEAHKARLRRKSAPLPSPAPAKAESRRIGFMGGKQR